MKKTLFLSSFIFLLLACSTDRNQTEEKTPGQNTYLYDQRAYPEGAINHKAFREAQAYKNTLSQAKFSGTPWESKGPLNIQGRISDIEMPIDDLNTIYIGAASGGIYRSNDQGFTWTAIFDDNASLSIGDMAISTSNTNVIYVGTGESNAGGGSLAYDGLGVFRSNDAGDSWEHVGLENVGSIGKVVIHPTNDDIVYVAAMGSLFGDNEDRGIFRTLDGGLNWEKVLYIDEQTGGIDLAINPDNPDRVYACLWQRVRRPDYRDYGGPNSGVFRSDDGGDTWHYMDNGLPPDWDSDKGRIGITLAPSNPAVLYLMYSDQSGDLRGIFKTTDGGDSWVQKSQAGLSSTGFMWWFGKIFIDPTNEDNVYMPAFYPHASRDGGDSWVDIFQNVHVDQHSFFIHPLNPDLVINGNDGGAYLSLDGGESYRLLENFNTIQFYTGAYNPHNPSHIYGGTQDNGTLRTLEDIDEYNRIYWGDGFVTRVDPVESNVVYAEYQYGNLAKSTNGGTNFNPATNGISLDDRRNWNSPYIISPHDHEVLYFGTQRLYKSTNQADFWTAISNDLTDDNPQQNLTYGTITAIAESPLKEGKLLCGTDDGYIWISQENGNDWTEISANLPLAWVTSVAFDPFDQNTLYASLSGYRYGDGDGNIYKSTDDGNTWENVNYNLITVPVNEVLPDPDQQGTLYIATDIGVFELVGEEWIDVSPSMPNVVITDIDFHRETRKLLAASYGKGMFETTLDPAIVSTEAAWTPEISIYPNPANSFITIECKTVPVTDKVSCQITDQRGRLVMERSGIGQIEQLDISHLQVGVYTIQLRSNQGIYSETFIKSGE